MGRVDLDPFGIFLFRAIYPGPTRFKSAFRYSTRLPPNTACAELGSGLIEKCLWSAFTCNARSKPPPYISKTFRRRCLWPVVLRKVYFDHVAKGRVVQDGFIQSRVVQGRVVKDGVIFDELIITGQIVQKRVVQNPVFQGLMVQGRYGKAFTQSRVVEGLLVRT